MIHRKKNDLLHKDATYNNLWQGVVVNRLKISQGLSTLKYRRWSQVPLWGGSTAIHRKKNDLLHKDAKYVCHSLWQWESVNRLRIPQGLSTLKYRRWSEVPAKGRGLR